MAHDFTNPSAGLAATARAAASAFLHRHDFARTLWRALYRATLLGAAALREHKQWRQLSRQTRKYIRRETARRARLSLSSADTPERRMAFVNDAGFLYGAGIAQKRQAASFLQSGWAVSVFASKKTQAPRYAYLTGRPEIDRRLSIGAPLPADPDAIANAVMVDHPELVIVGNIHAAGWPIKMLATLRDRGANVIAYMHDCYWITGRCAYPRTCERYVTGCDAACPTPNEYPKLAPDKIAAAWNDRAKCFTGPRAVPLVANSQWTAQLAQKRYPAARVDVIHLGLDHNLFAPMPKEAARRMLGLPQDKPIILLGAVNVEDEFKGGPVFRNLCRLLVARSDIRVAVIGRGSQAIDGVHALGLVNDERLMPLILNCADVYVSTAIQEAFGQMLLEAAACGLPTVAIEAGGVSDIVTTETGVLVREQTAASLMAAIDVLLSADTLRKTMGRAARDRVLRHFTLAHQASAWEKYVAAISL